MKPYVKIYLEYFGYSGLEYMPCEICGAPAVDVCHIWAKSIREDLRNDIKNLMGCCRECHTKYGDKKGETRERLQERHNDFMQINGRRDPPPPPEVKPKKRQKLYRVWK